MGVTTMSGVLALPLLVMVAVVGIENGGGAVAVELFSSKLMHRFSDELKADSVSRSRGEVARFPRKWSSEYYRRLLSSDLQRQKVKLGPQFDYLFPSQGSTTLSTGDDYGWLHYTWIDIGTPNVSFLVALDTGSDLLWVPCDCMQCAPLSASYYSNLGKDLSEYNPSDSNTSKVVPCSHHLCEGGSSCKSPKDPCPYRVNYDTADTSTSGLLIEDILHLASGGTAASKKFVRAPIMLGCGSKQSGIYLSGVAPDGLMGLGLGNISVPSFLSKAGFSRNSFSLCLKEDTGRIFFGDQGIPSQHTTPFLPFDDINAYIVGVETSCVESYCLEKTNFKALVDSGTSFTFLPDAVYQKLAGEFDRQINATKFSFEGDQWQYCYKFSSEELPKTPSLSLKFSANNSFVVINPVFAIYGSQGAVGFCLAIQPTNGDIGTIGQNFFIGYRMVFDRENMKLGWSHSNCEDLTDEKGMPMTPSGSASPKPLPTTQQQSKPNGRAVAPAEAGRAPSKSTATSVFLVPGQFYISEMMLIFWPAAYIFLAFYC
ncbi:aspartic proteinase-like protein 1 [Coffea arabica]|nr:aspartic proteinase-like protein 1 [Coffea arabica]